MPISSVESSKLASDSDDHYEDRVNHAAVFRMSARLDMHESVANHFSYAVSNDGSRFLVNPMGRHFSNIRASELLLLDANDNSTMDKPNAPFAWPKSSLSNSEVVRPGQLVLTKRFPFLGLF